MARPHNEQICLVSYGGREATIGCKDNGQYHDNGVYSRLRTYRDGNGREEQSRCAITNDIRHECDNQEYGRD